uniref:Uncharacterized protein n=1 Tax=Seriola dumerili TaxID=41447 RepID=A0A3B4UK51_SERDU
MFPAATFCFFNLSSRLITDLLHQFIELSDTFPTNHICGVTNGGKTTLTNCCVVHQDDFFNTITNTLDTEIVPKSDHKEKETHICHVEGFLSSTYGPLIEVLNQHYLISIPYKDCKKRTCWRWYFSDGNLATLVCIYSKLRKDFTRENIFSSKLFVRQTLLKCLFKQN